MNKKVSATTITASVALGKNQIGTVSGCHAGQGMTTVNNILYFFKCDNNKNSVLLKNGFSTKWNIVRNKTSVFGKPNGMTYAEGALYIITGNRDTPVIKTDLNGNVLQKFARSDRAFSKEPTNIAYMGNGNFIFRTNNATELDFIICKISGNQIVATGGFVVPFSHGYANPEFQDIGFKNNILYVPVHKKDSAYNKILCLNYNTGKTDILVVNKTQYNFFEIESVDRDSSGRLILLANIKESEAFIARVCRVTNY